MLHFTRSSPSPWLCLLAQPAVGAGAARVVLAVAVVAGAVGAAVAEVLLAMLDHCPKIDFCLYPRARRWWGCVMCCCICSCIAFCSVIAGCAGGVGDNGVGLNGSLTLPGSRIVQCCNVMGVMYGLMHPTLTLNFLFGSCSSTTLWSKTQIIVYGSFQWGESL